MKKLPDEFLRVLIAASGSGGHIFPALAMARALEKKDPHVVILFVGSGRPLEEALIDAAGYERVTIPVSQIRNKGFSGLLKFILNFPSAWFATSKIFSDFKPHVTVGVGGYASVLPIVMSWWYGTPSWVHEAELKTGMANEVNVFFANKVSLAFPGAKIPYKEKHVESGHPIREEIIKIAETKKVTPLPRNILVVGGSQGANGLDWLVEAAVKQLPRATFDLIHQSRPENVTRLAHSYTESGVRAHVVPFINDMADAYAWADVVISRAGAGSVMEIGALNLPSILVPIPIPGIHQEENAKYLEEAGKAITVHEGREDSLSKMVEALRQLMTPKSYLEMKKKPTLARNLAAADTIADGILALVQHASVKENLSK
jgi:UDP-N-acetylglucosamine--N-acetylmuramyl-(pentapeptide) pyrophosphoryl-undecaprenol N-acetylglucosamine transferase